MKEHKTPGKWYEVHIEKRDSNIPILVFKDGGRRSAFLSEIYLWDKYTEAVRLLEEAFYTLCHARTFMVSRQKMHPTGVELNDKLLTELEALLNETKPRGTTFDKDCTPTGEEDGG